MPEIYPWLLDLGFDGVVGGGGSFAAVGGEVLFEHLISPADISEVSAFFDAHGVDYIWQSSTGLYPTPGFVSRFRAQFESAARAEARGEAAGQDWRQLFEIFHRAEERSRGHEIRAGKGTFVCRRDATVTVPDVQDQFRGRFVVIRGSIDIIGPENGEIMIPNVNKGTAALEVARRLGFPAAATVGVGDSDNDVEMIRDCGVGVAMGNGRPEVKAVADFVTSDIDDDGLARAFAHLGLTPSLPPH